jgi:hypothetical protein
VQTRGQRKAFFLNIERWTVFFMMSIEQDGAGAKGMVLSLSCPEIGLQKK